MELAPALAHCNNFHQRKIFIGMLSPPNSHQDSYIFTSRSPTKSIYKHKPSFGHHSHLGGKECTTQKCIHLEKKHKTHI